MIIAINTVKSSPPPSSAHTEISTSNIVIELRRNDLNAPNIDTILSKKSNINCSQLFVMQHYPLNSLKTKNTTANISTIPTISPKEKNPNTGTFNASPIEMNASFIELNPDSTVTPVPLIGG